MPWVISLTKWREARPLTMEPSPEYLLMMNEEIAEYEAAVLANNWHEQVDAICDQLVLTTNQLFTEGHGDSLQGAQVHVPSTTSWVYGGSNRDVLMQTRGELLDKLHDLGVIPDLAMKEVVKHISCRKQDPKQKVRWLTNPVKEKWLKWKDQPAEELYEPNYERCRFKAK